MIAEDIAEKDWLTFASGNECFDFLLDDAEDVYSEEDGIPIEMIIS